MAPASVLILKVKIFWETSNSKTSRFLEPASFPLGVSEWILIKSPDQSQRLLQGERGPQKGTEKPGMKIPHGGSQ